MIALLRKHLILFLLSRFKVPRDLLRFAFKMHANKIALVSDDKSLTYAELGCRTMQLAKVMTDFGVHSQTPVFAWLEDYPFVITRMAALECGAAFTGFHPSTTELQLDAAINALNPLILFHDPSKAEVVSRMQSRHPTLQTVAFNAEFEKHLQEINPGRSKNIVRPEHISGFTFTSGTTGVPKILTATQKIYMTSMTLLIKNIRISNNGSKHDRILIGIPFAGAGSGAILPTLAGGGTIIMADAYDPKTISGLIEKHRATRMFITPGLLIDLLDLPPSERHDWSSLTALSYGTEWLPSPKIEEALRCFGPIVQQGYGCSEVLPPVCMLSAEDHWSDGVIASRETLSSIGRPVPEVSIMIANDDDLALPDGETGQMLIKSPTVFPGYWQHPELTAEALRGGWYHTGDMGYRDQGGLFHVLGRKADQLSRNGRTFYPRRIEEALHDHPAVKEAACVQVGDEIVMAFSLRRAYWRQQTTAYWYQTLSTFMSARIPAQDNPDRFHLFEELPRSALGKLLRRELRTQLRGSAPKALT